MIFAAAGLFLAALAVPYGHAEEPGQIERRIETPKAPRRPVGPIVAPKVKPRPETTDVEKFVLTGANITGSTRYEPAELSFAYEGHLGREISVSEVSKILEAITEKYRNDGYFLSRATAPAQAARFGILQIQIIEGFVESVTFSGDKPGGDRVLKAMAQRISASRPLKLSVLERYLLLMADSPGLRVFPTLKPLDIERGAYVLDIGLRHDALDGFANLDNRGTTAVGPLQAFVGANFNSVFGMLERTGIGIFTVPDAPKELRYAQITHEQLLNAEGTRAWMSLSRSLVDTDGTGTGVPELSSGSRLTAGLTHPFIRSRDLSITGNLTFDGLDSEKNAPGDDFEDKLRVLRLGGQIAVKDDWHGENFAAVELSKGLDALGASDPRSQGVSRAGGRSDFLKFRIDAARRQRLQSDIHVLFKLAAQKSGHTLLSSEEFSLGGRQFGRAYDPAIFTGSDGLAGAIELQFTPTIKSPALKEAQIYAFYDLGAVWSENSNRHSLASAGAGVRMRLPFDLFADLELAWPLTGATPAGETENSKPRIFFNILSRF